MHINKYIYYYFADNLDLYLEGVYYSKVVYTKVS